MSDPSLTPGAVKRIAVSHGIDLSNVDVAAFTEHLVTEGRLNERLASTRFDSVKTRVADLERQLDAATKRWQRVLRAYIALRDVKELTVKQPHAPAYAKLLIAERALASKDLKVIG